MAARLVALIFLSVLPLSVLCDTCLAPDFKAKTYTTSEAPMSDETVFIVEFTVKCKNNIQGMNLYGEVDGRILPASRSSDGSNTYQVSWNVDHKQAPAGTYNVRLFDEDGYSALRKAQRSGDDSSTVKSLFTVAVEHKGTWKGLWVSSELVALSVAGLVWYFAYSAKSKMQA